MLKNLNLRMKMLLYIGMVAFLSFAVTIGVVAVKAGNMAEESATENVTQVPFRYGGIVKAEIEVAMDTARTLAQAFEGIKHTSNQPDRQMINGMLKQIMVMNPQFFGAWTIWEPDALDGRDSEFVNTPGHDGSGRFVPIWERYSGKLVFRACGKYDQEGAGEAGKGFAVVAAEIKELARLTTEATNDIREKIVGIQQVTSVSVESIGAITKIIDDINEISVTIATAIEEQSVTTQEIAGNVAQASHGLAEISENVAQSSRVSEEITTDISEVSRQSNEMTNSSSTVSLNAGELLKLAENLKKMVGNFKV